ncbi:putative transcription factor C3H family [Helianthus debilis subsp. tardiflorus]
MLLLMKVGTTQDTMLKNKSAQEIISFEDVGLFISDRFGVALQHLAVLQLTNLSILKYKCFNFNLGWSNDFHMLLISGLHALKANTFEVGYDIDGRELNDLFGGLRSHDWTECPFVHPGENARRRDPRKFHYSCVPCLDFRKGACRRADICEYAHGVFECWLHLARYRTRLCKDGTSCARRVCFFVHTPEELRPLYVSTGSAVPSPRSSVAGASVMDMTAALNLLPGSPSSSVMP